MRLSVPELLRRIYIYYPRGVQRYGSNYMETEERARFVELCRRAATSEERDRVVAMLNRLRRRFPGHNVDYGSLHLGSGSHEPSHRATLELEPETPEVEFCYIGFIVSLIAPCYVIYRASRKASPEIRHLPWSEQVDKMKPLEVSFTFAEKEKPFAEAICAEVQSTYHSEILPPEIGNIPVPDVCARDLILGNETLLTCLCSDTW